MRFGEIVTAVASWTFVYILLELVMLAVMVPVNSCWGPDISTIVSLLVASLIVGYTFAAKINEESGIGAISRIAVLSTVMLMFLTMASMVNPYTGVAVKEGLESMFATSGWTTWDWVAYSQLIMVMLVALNVVLALVFSFVGLYASSLLRKRKQGQK